MSITGVADARDHLVHYAVDAVMSQVTHTLWASVNNRVEGVGRV